MSDIKIKTRIQNKINTKTTWETLSADYVLLNGELAVITNENSENWFKVGNGLSTFSQLPYSTQLIKNISISDYNQLVVDDNVDENTLYILSGDVFEIYGQRIVNVAPGTELSDAVNLEQLNSVVGLSTDLSTAVTLYGIKNYTSAAITASYTDTKNQLSNDGYALTNQLSTAADISTAVNLSDYALANSVSSTTELNTKFNTLSTYSQIKHQLSSDGYAIQSNIPSYNDISTNIHLSDYALANSVSSKEDTSNKVTALLSTSTDDQYPTAKCMYDIIGNIESVLDTINNGGAQ